MRLRSYKSPKKEDIVQNSISKKRNLQKSIKDKCMSSDKNVRGVKNTNTPLGKIIETDIMRCPLIKTPITCRQSSKDGWRRAFTKYSPTTEIYVSPVKYSQANLQSVLTETSDSYMDIFSWVVNMSEQFYYDNILLLLNAVKSNKDKINKTLRHNSSGIKLSFFNNLVNITLVGEGTYGSVYSCKDTVTETSYAIKYINPTSNEILKHCEKILDYMSERNSMIRAMNSPFIMRFYYSLRVKSTSGLFLFFEYCIGDLYTYVHIISHKDFHDISKKLKQNEQNLIENLDKNTNVLDVSLMYIFELFCGLDFLVQSNIIHQDIKLENLMVSETLHLKIGDFGIVYRTRTIHRESNNMLVTADDINTTESSNYELFIEGTPLYQDFEIKLMHLEAVENPLFKKVKKDKIFFDMPNIKLNSKTLAPTFLADSWAAGVVSITLLLQGFQIFYPEMMHPKLFNDIPRSDQSEFLVHLVGRKSVYKKYLHDGLIKSGGQNHKELMQFLASIFVPRSNRAEMYSKDKIIYKFGKKRTVRYVDMDKIENIKSFKNRKFNRNTVFTLGVPPEIRGYFTKYISPRFPNFKAMLSSLSKRSGCKSVITLEPGITINNFQ